MQTRPMYIYDSVWLNCTFFRINVVEETITHFLLVTPLPPQVAPFMICEKKM